MGVVPRHSRESSFLRDATISGGFSPPIKQRFRRSRIRQEIARIDEEISEYVTIFPTTHSARYRT